MTETKRVCGVCKGTGHDAGGRPVIKLEPYTDKRGVKRKRHITKSQGSGCIQCGGKVV